MRVFSRCWLIDLVVCFPTVFAALRSDQLVSVDAGDVTRHLLHLRTLLPDNNSGKNNTDCTPVISGVCMCVCGGGGVWPKCTSFPMAACTLCSLENSSMAALIVP